MKKAHQTYVSIGVILSFMTLITIFAFRQEAQTNNPNQVNQQDQDDQPTIVRRGQVTGKEREISKEYKKLYSFRRGRKFTEKIEEIQQRLGKTTEGFGEYVGGYEGFYLPNAPILTPLQFLANLSCKSDAIVIGTIKSKTAHMTDDETFIYTEYDLVIKEVLKNNSADPLDLNKNIQITRSGGLIELDGKRIRITDRSSEPLQKNKDYLLFLKFVPSANQYMASSPEGDFIYENNAFRTISKHPTPKELENNDPNKLVSAIRDAVSAGCNQGSNQ